MVLLIFILFVCAASPYQIQEPDGEECVNGQQDANLFDSCKYFRCINGEWIEMTCDDGWTYNPVYQSCQVESSSPKKVWPKPTPSKSCDPPSPCPLGQYYADNCNCRKFYQCDHGGAVHKDCGPGTAFNPNIIGCDYPYNVPLCKALGQEYN